MKSILHCHSIREQCEENFKAEVVEKEKSLNDAKSLAETKAAKHTTHVEELMTSLNKLKAAKKVDEGDAKKVAEAIEGLKKYLLEAKEVRTNLEAKADMAEAKTVHTEAKLKRAEEALAKVEAKIEDKINAGRDEQIDLIMYRIWDRNQNIDILFMEGEA